MSTVRRIDHPLLAPSLGCQKTVSSWHFGSTAASSTSSEKLPKVYIQASLHADELPGMLVAHHLHTLLEAADAQGDVLGEVVLVPVANPIGLAQRLDHKPMGRFDLDTAENFNRHYPDFPKELFASLRNAFTQDGAANVSLVRQAMRDYLQRWVPATELHSLRHTLLTWAHDADYVLDLHCDAESILHLYTEEACWSALEPLARLLQCQAVLLAKNSGGDPFDECLSGIWWKLADACSAAGLQVPLPQGCHSTTIELRGEADVGHALAQVDAQAIFAFLQSTGVVRGVPSTSTPAPAPTLPCQPTPLAGSQTLHAPAPGVVVFAAQVGQPLAIGDLVAEIIDPLSRRTHRVEAGVAGILYARIRDRYVHAGGELGKIAGATPFRTGALLGA